MYSIVRVCQQCIIFSRADEHLGSYWFLAITNNTAMNILTNAFWGDKHPLPLSVYKEMELLVKCLTLVDKAGQFSREIVPIHSPTNSCEFQLLHILFNI